MFSWLKKILLVDFCLLIVIASLFFFYRDSIYKFNKKVHECKVQTESGDLYVNVHTRGGKSDTWQKQISTEDGTSFELMASIYDVDIKNKSYYQVPDWNVRFNIVEDCFLNNGWCGVFEIHQFNENNEEIVQEIDLRKYNIDEIKLNCRVIASDMLIPLKKGDYFIYYPSRSASEYPIPKSNASINDLKSVTFGLIMYFPSKPGKFWSDDSVAYFKMEKGFHDDVMANVIIISLIFVLAFTLFTVSLNVFRYIDNQNNEKEKRKLYFDSLTGIYNRNRFIAEVEKALADDLESKYIILCSNIKGFKFYNYGYGEEEGNEFLKSFAEILKAKRQKYSTFIYGRLWRDEFVMLLKDSEYNEVDFEDFLIELRSRFENESFRVQLKFGAYRIQDNRESVVAMCDKAIMAESKFSDDINKLIYYYDDMMLQQSMNERWVITHFDSGLHAVQFLVFLQPQVTPDGVVRGAEALVRWNNHERGLVSPGFFVPILEQAGVIHHLDKFIWERSVQILSEWKKKGRDDFYISVNVSGKDFEMYDLYDIFTSLVEKYDVSPSKLKIEVTESVMLEKGIRYTSILRALRFYGFSIEIDDFGSGYSSLNTLKDIEADVIKIDMRFLQGDHHVEKGNLIIGCIIDMVHKLDMRVVSEGVETEEQVKFLSQIGCDVFQGYYFAKPMPVDEFEKKYLGNI